MIPAAIDSHGKPGTAGTTRGVVALDDDDEEDAVTVRVLTDVAVAELLVDWLVAELEVWVEVLTWVDVVAVEAELVVLEIVEVEEDDVLELEVLVVVTICMVVTIWVGRSGGSRWKIPDSDVVPEIPAPTAKPSVGDVRYTEYNPRPGASAGAIGILVQAAPSQWAKTGFPAGSYPTAQPSPLPEPVP
jgi:hypothetical protein